MKHFIFDRLVDRENICNLSKEQDMLKRYVARGEKVIVYAPRNCDKTSVMKNIIIEDFKKKKKRCFVFFADLTEIRSTESLVARLTNAFERSFEESFPIKHLFENARHFLSSLRPEVSIDALTGSPSLSLGAYHRQSVQTVISIFAHVAKITRELPCLVVLDEFQDVVKVDEAPGVLRAAFEEIASAPVVLLGSKRHMLSELFSKPEAPLAGWGTDLEFPPIPYEDYHRYMMDRFRQNALAISFKNAKHLQELMYRVPEAVNRLCQQIMDFCSRKDISRNDIAVALRKLLENRESRYESYLSRFSETEETVLTELAKAGTVEKPQSKAFLAKTNLSNRTIRMVFQRLIDRGIIEKTGSIYHISDPLLATYLGYYR